MADMPRKRPLAAAERVVTFKPDPDGRYGYVSCSWEKEKPRKTPITREAAVKFAEGWKAELIIDSAW